MKVRIFYCIQDIHFIFISVCVMAALQLPGQTQTWLLYHNVVSTNVVVSDTLRCARRTQESGGKGEGKANADMMDQVNKSKTIVH
jgi:callose synthase